jgi:hypothetical protein
MSTGGAKTAAPSPYERPAVTVLGRVSTLTLTLKQFGSSDGFTYMGAPIANASA